MNTDEMTAAASLESNANEMEIITGTDDGAPGPREDGTSDDGNDITGENGDDDENGRGVGNPGTDGPGSDDNNPAGDAPAGDGTGDSDGSPGESAGESAGGRLPMIGMVMNACVSLINGDTPDEELSSLLDALRAHERIERLLQQIAETESRCKEEVEALREEMEIKVSEAYAAGEIAGRNAVISETLTSAEMTEALPRLGGSPAPRMHQPNSIFDLAARAR